MRAPKTVGYVLCALALGGVTPASAQDSTPRSVHPDLQGIQEQLTPGIDTLEHQFHMAGRQSMLTQKTSKAFLLVALGVEPDKSLTNLESSRVLFGQTLAKLTHGEEELKRESSTDESVSERLLQVKLLWPLFDEVISDTISASQITEVSRAAELSETLLNAKRDTGTAYADALKDKRPYSLLALSIESAKTLRMLTQKMAQEFLLIAYGHQPERNRESLEQTYAEIENILGSLLDGDAERQLLSAPTPAIRASLIVAQEHLRQLKPTILAALSGDPIGDEQIPQEVQHNEPILAPLEPLIDLYQAI
jgi:hypothetical protein